MYSIHSASINCEEDFTEGPLAYYQQLFSFQQNCDDDINPTQSRVSDSLTEIF